MTNLDLVSGKEGKIVLSVQVREVPVIGRRRRRRRRRRKVYSRLTRGGMRVWGEDRVDISGSGYEPGYL